MLFKNYLTLAVIIFTSINSTAQYDSISYGSTDRTFLLHLPIGYDGTSDLPLIIAMHGGFGNAYNIESQSQLSAKADTENFIVVYPEGVIGGLLNISSWNAGWCCGYASNLNVDDVGFIAALLDTLIDLYSIDTNRVYATGMSNGGFMSYRLACELSDRIAAIAPVAASMSMVNCDPTRSVPIIGFHSYLDANVPYSGGVGSGASNHYNSPQDSVLNIWGGINSCLNVNDTIMDDSQYTFIRWTACDCDAEIHYYITQDGGHSWSGGIQTALGDSPSNFINATDLMWSFFQQHTLDCNAVSVPSDLVEKKKIYFYPNPTSGLLRVHSEIIHEQLEISIFNITGQKIDTVKNKTEINISHLKKGTYFISIKMNETINTEKIIKIE